MLADQIWTNLKLEGPLRGPDLQARLGISQPTLSRALRDMEQPVLVVGKARRTTYAARREIPDVPAPVPVYEVSSGPTRPRLLCRLHPIWPKDGVWVEPVADDAPRGFFDDLPWFLNDLRPAGYLGRLVPQLHPELELPRDILGWQADDVLRYSSAAGSDAPGALIVGERAYAAFLERAARPSEPVSERCQAWPRRAEDALASGTPGSSAAGERPKFLATVAGPDGPVQVLVKFSPQRTNPVAQRIADLLICEALALQVVEEAGVVDAARARIVEADGRVFLEVERFDRVGALGRRGLMSMLSLDAEYVGSDLSSWSGASSGLVDQGLIGPDDDRRIRWLERFGHWIGNTDMHLGNLSFFARGHRPIGLAPAYDMVPMLWFPRGHELVEVRFDPAPPSPRNGDIARTAWTAACAFWSRAAENTRLSSEFRAIAATSLDQVRALAPVLDLLPAV